ncbi:sodium:proton antiporter [Halostagnicola larsenii XH-48]|uniref:Sodium:proton antiporter n=1 Tax=Halostagnicola larsenii XH-48 TaxID=797299 RepID=W0JK01_9EURY|nr:Na+/H+ antiporter NhaC family protein [Halostagnicola larsenii]AHF98928.1 sodium:proton antiporter [Halostagnicola larsenii XH-48]
MPEFGALSILPPLLAIVLAIVTRRPMLSLFLGIWSGAIIYTESLGIAQTFDWIVSGIIADDGFYVEILLFTLLLGSGVALIWRLGGATAVRQWATANLQTRRNVGLTTWLLGLLLFFDDYANTAIVGSTMRELSDQLRISREKLSYIVDSTSAPVATIGLSSWVAFQLSLIADAYDGLDGVSETPTAFETFIGSIPFNTYALLAIVMVGVIVYTGRDYGEMLTAEHRAWSSGKVNRDDAQPLQEVEKDLGEPIEDKPMLRTFFGPVVVLLAVTLSGAVWTGHQSWLSAQEEAGAPTAFGAAADESGTVQVLVDIVGAGNFTSSLIWGSFAMVTTAIAIGIAYDLFDLSDGVETVLDGFRLMLTAVTILVLAWGISSTTDALGTGDFVAGVVGASIPAALLPLVILFVSAFVAFTMGSSWATMTIVTPIAITVAFEMTGTFEPMPVVVGAVFSGAIFGDHTSPISDTSVLSSTFTGADLIDHVRTQFYYAGTVMAVVIVCYLLYGFLEVPPLIFLPLGFVLLVGLVYALSELDARRRGVEPVVSNVPQEDPESVSAREPTTDSTE